MNRKLVAAASIVAAACGIIFAVPAIANAATAPKGPLYAYCTSDLSKVPKSMSHGYAVTQKVSHLNSAYDKVTICLVQPEGSKRLPGEILWTYPAYPQG